MITALFHAHASEGLTKVLRVLFLLALGLASAVHSSGIVSRTAVNAAACQSPHLHPDRVLVGPIPQTLGAHVGGIDVAVNPRGDIVWSEQAPPPAAGRLYFYDAARRTVRMLVSLHADDGQALGRLALSDSWLAFATARNTDGSDWRIVARNMRTGRELVIARGREGGLLSGQLALDGNTLVWIQPGTGSTEIKARDLKNGSTRVLAHTSTRSDTYTWLSADHGHAVWEWDRRVGGTGATDVLAVDERGGQVVHVTATGAASQPASSWPDVAYLPVPHFAPPRVVVITSVGSGATVRVGGGTQDDYPRLGHGVLVYTPGLPAGSLGFYSLNDKRSVILKLDAQRTIDGAFVTRFTFAGNHLVALGTQMHKGGSKYVVVSFTLRTVHPLSHTLSCA